MDVSAFMPRAAAVAHAGNFVALMTAPAVKSLALVLGPAALILGGTRQAAGVIMPHQGLAERWQTVPLRIMAPETAVILGAQRSRICSSAQQLVFNALPASQVLPWQHLSCSLSFTNEI